MVTELISFLRGDWSRARDWVAEDRPARLGFYLAVIFLGTGVYGAAIGWWRSPLQAGCDLVKFPVAVVATTLTNALLNGMLAPLLGLNLRFRQSLLLVLVSFALAATILAAFSPVAFFVVANVPSMGEPFPWGAYHAVVLFHVAVIAYAGVAANVRLRQLLELIAGSRAVARKVLFAWLAGNLFLGSQFCWVLRPFIGSPHLPVQLIRAEAFRSNFYESVGRMLWHVANRPLSESSAPNRKSSNTHER